MDTSRVIKPPVLYPGTPVVLLSSVNPDGTANLAPMSSAWAIGDLMALGLGTEGRTFANLCARPECVVNFASEDLWKHVAALAPLTGADPVPAIVEVRILWVHAHASVVEPDDRHIRVDEWRPLFYMFRHYVGRGSELGRSFRATSPG